MLGSPLIRTNVSPVSYCTVAEESGWNDKLQHLHESGTIMCDGASEQASQTDAKQFCMYNSSLHVHSWSRKPMHSQYCHLTEKPPLDMRTTNG